MKSFALALFALAALDPSAAFAQTAQTAPPAPNPWAPSAPAGLPPPPPPPGAFVEAPAPRREVGFTTTPEARHAVYVEATSMIFTNSVGVSYAWRPLRGLAVSAGLGAGLVTAILVSVAGYGGQVMAHALLGGDSPSSFELAAGGAVVATRAGWFLNTDTTGGVAVSPSAFVGYRYHPLDGGFLFRAGAAWTYGLGIGANLTFGGAF